MISPSPPDLFPQRPVRSEFSRAPSYRTRRIITVIVVLAILGGGAKLIFGGVSAPKPGEIPTITAEGSWKQKPDRPGGLDIPHQDVQVYQELDGKEDARPQVEHLLPPPEMPQPQAEAATAKPAPFPQPPVLETEKLMPKIETTVTDTAPAPVPESSPSPAAVGQSAPSALAPPPAADSAPAPVPSPAPAPIVTAAPAPAPVPPASVVPAVPPKPVKAAAAAQPHAAKTRTIEQVIADANTNSAPDTSSGPRRAVQLASVQDPAIARDMADKLQGKYSDILGSNQLRLVKADLGEKGIFYRIETLPVSESQAANICSALKKVKAGCILVRP